MLIEILARERKIFSEIFLRSWSKIGADRLKFLILNLYIKIKQANSVMWF